MKLALVVALVMSSVGLQPDLVAKPEPVVDNGEFMDIFLKASYSELQDAMAQPPTDRRGWAIIYQRAIRVAELAIDKQAQTLLMPVSARRQLNDLPDELWTKISIEFYVGIGVNSGNGIWLCQSLHLLYKMLSFW